MCGTEGGSHSTAKEDATITGPSQAPLCLGYTAVSAQFADVLSKYVMFLQYFIRTSQIKSLHSCNPVTPTKNVCAVVSKTL